MYFGNGSHIKIIDDNVPFFSEKRFHNVADDDKLRYVVISSLLEHEFEMYKVGIDSAAHLSCTHFGGILIERSEEFNEETVIPICSTCGGIPQYKWQPQLFQAILHGIELEFPEVQSGWSMDKGFILASPATSTIFWGNGLSDAEQQAYTDAFKFMMESTLSLPLDSLTQNELSTIAATEEGNKRTLATIKAEWPIF